MDHFLNTLHSSPNMINQDALSPDDLIIKRQMEDFRSRSVTIVIWYQANADPIRLHQMLPTFPYFQLSQCSDLISDLQLSPSSYLDTWIPSSCHWEQQTISVVRLVQTQQRLLYKIRRRLTDPLPDSECISLPEELQLQGATIDLQQPQRRSSADDSSTSSSPAKSSRPLSIHDTNVSHNKRPHKRSSPTSDVIHHDVIPKIQVLNSYYLPHSGPSALPDQGPPPHSPDGRDHNEDNMFIFQNMFYTQSQPQDSPTDPTNASPNTPITLPQYLLSPNAAPSPIPYHPHPPLKRWPNDYTVSEISRGFHSMDLLIAHNASSGGMTQRQAFERVFGCRYVKSTVCRHRAVWRKANEDVKTQFESLGDDERAVWGEFVRRVEGRPPGKTGGLGGGDHQIMASSPTGAMGYQSGDEEDVREGVMTLQNQVVAGPPNQANGIVYDHPHPRTRLG